MFNNFGRQIVDNSIIAMSRGVLKKKKRDLERIMDREGYNTPAYLMSVANRIGKAGAFDKNKSGFAVALDYKKATHYFVSSLPNIITLNAKVGANRNKCLYEIDDIFTIECDCRGVDIFAQFVNLMKDKIEPNSVYINGDRIAWSISVFIRAVTENICPVHYPLYIGYISEDLEHVYFIANSYHPVVNSFDTKPVQFKIEGKGSFAVKAIVLNAKSRLVKVTSEHLLDCVTFIYKEITDSKNKKSKSDEEDIGSFISDFLNKAINGDFDKVEESVVPQERAISVAKESKIAVEVEDKLVPLRTYLREYVPSKKKAPKGGHHASPVPHDRRGFYRRSRGKGDYDLINGEFVYVGDKKGMYSWVPATHVGEKKIQKKPTYIYKV